MENNPMPIRRYDYTSRILQAHEAGRKDWLEVIMKSIMYDQRFHAREYSDFCFLGIQLKMAQELLYDTILTEEAVVLDIEDDMYERYQFVINVIDKYNMTPEQKAIIMTNMIQQVNYGQNYNIGSIGVVNKYYKYDEPANNESRSKASTDAKTQEGETYVSDKEVRIQHAITEIEHCPFFNGKGDWAWVRVAMMIESIDITFKADEGFLIYMKNQGAKDLPDRTRLCRLFNTVRKNGNEYSFSDEKDRNEVIRRNNIIRKFVASYKLA